MVHTPIVKHLDVFVLQAVPKNQNYYYMSPWLVLHLEANDGAALM